MGLMKSLNEATKKGILDRITKQAESGHRYVLFVHSSAAFHFQNQQEQDEVLSLAMEAFEQNGYQIAHMTQAADVGTWTFLMKKEREAGYERSGR